MVEADPENIIQIKSEEQYDKGIAENKFVIVDFHAVWCPPCKRMKPILLEIAKKNPTLKILRVDADTNKPLIIKFNVSSIPKLIIYCDGKNEKELTGYDEQFLQKELVGLMPEFKA